MNEGTFDAGTTAHKPPRCLVSGSPFLTAYREKGNSMSFLDLRFAAELLKQGFTREEILGMIAGKPEAADAAPIKKEETPSAVSGGTSAAPAAPASTGPPAAAAPEGSPAASPPEGSPHSRTETKTEKKTFAQLLAENS